MRTVFGFYLWVVRPPSLVQSGTRHRLIGVGYKVRVLSESRHDSSSNEDIGVYVGPLSH